MQKLLVLFFVPQALLIEQHKQCTMSTFQRCMAFKALSIVHDKGSQAVWCTVGCEDAYLAFMALEVVFQTALGGWGYSS